MSLEREEKRKGVSLWGGREFVVAQQHDSEAELSIPKCTCDLTESMTQGLRGEKRKEKNKCLAHYLINAIFKRKE